MPTVNISGFQAQFMVDTSAIINVPMLDTYNNPVTGRTYPGSLNIQLWKGGYDSSAQLYNVTSVETASGVYRTTLPGILINVPLVDYLLIMSDSSNAALTQRVPFSAFQVSGFQAQFVVGRTVTINVPMLDSSNASVTGRTYPGNLAIQLWKGGVLDSSSQITAVETASGVYRTTIPAALVDSSAIDYELIMSDNSNVALTQHIQFSATSPGPRTVTIVVTDSFTTSPIADTQVYIKDSSNTFILYNGNTDSFGKYTVGLPDGSYSVILKKSFIVFSTPISLIVSADTTVPYLGASFSPASPSPPSTCILYGWISGVDGRPIRNASIAATDPINATYSGSFKVGKTTKSTVTNNDGYWSIELIKNSNLVPQGVPYTITQTYPGYSYSKNVIIPDTSSVEFSTL
jgi:hypothetical protein